MRHWHKERYSVAYSVRSLTLEPHLSHSHEQPSLRGSARPRQRDNFGSIAYIFCATNAAVFTAAIAPFLRRPTLSRDLISGAVAWSGVDKGVDFRLFHAFLASFGLLLTLVLGLGRRLQQNAAMIHAVERAFAFSLIPAALWLGTRLPTNSFGDIPVESLFCGAAVFVLFFALFRTQPGLTAQQLQEITDGALFVLLFGFFGGLGISTMLCRVFGIGIPSHLTLLLAAGCGSLQFLLLLLLISSSCTAGEIEKRIHQILLASQALLPLLWAVVIPPALVENSQRRPSSTSVSLLFAVLTAASISWVQLLRRWRAKDHFSSKTLRAALVPLAIVPIAVFFATDHIAYPTFVGDDFHTGEHLLPWQQLHDFGKLPFVGFNPVHPLMDFFVSAVNALFFDGTLANYANGTAILFAIGAAAIFLAVARFAHVGLALCLAVAANLWDRLLLVPALLVFLCDGKLWSQRRRWLICWILICPLALLYNPAAGVALTLASIPFSLIQFWLLLRQDRTAAVRLICGCAAAGMVLLLIPPIPAMFAGFARFMIENGRDVALAHGLEWQADKAQMSSLRGVLATPMVWETFRFSWIIALIVAVLVFLRAAGNRVRYETQALTVSAMAALFLFFLAGWTINRIDASSPSRTGEVSYLACLFILPLVLFSAHSWSHRAILVLFLAIGFFRSGMAGFINSGSRPHLRLTLQQLVDKPGAVFTVPQNCTAIDGAALGLPNLGRIYSPRTPLDSVLRLRSALQELMRPGETYLDLTGRQANYFYLGLPVPVSYGATWLAANSLLENKLLAEIKLHPPSVVWLAPGQFENGDAPPLRIYKVYRFLMQHYVAVSRAGNIFLVKPDRTTPAPTQKDQLKILRGLFSLDLIEHIPSSWGASWPKLQGQFTAVEQLNVASDVILKGEATSLGLKGGALEGGKCDFLKIDLFHNLSPQSRMEMEVIWTTENGQGTIRFVADNGTHLIPIGICPDWLLSHTISQIKIAPVAPPAELKYALRNPELLRLNE